MFKCDREKEARTGSGKPQPKQRLLDPPAEQELCQRIERDGEEDSEDEQRLEDVRDVVEERVVRAGDAAPHLVVGIGRGGWVGEGCVGGVGGGRVGGERGRGVRLRRWGGEEGVGEQGDVEVGEGEEGSEGGWEEAVG